MKRIVLAAKVSVAARATSPTDHSNPGNIGRTSLPRPHTIRANNKLRTTRKALNARNPVIFMLDIRPVYADAGGRRQGNLAHCDFHNARYSAPT